MPKVTVYVRKDDLPKWKAVNKKTEFISKALNVQKHHIETKYEGGGMVSAKVVPSTSYIDTNKVTEVCKHGSSPQFCKFAKPGKPCK